MDPRAAERLQGGSPPAGARDAGSPQRNREDSPGKGDALTGARGILELLVLHRPGRRGLLPLCVCAFLGIKDAGLGWRCSRLGESQTVEGMEGEKLGEN